MTATAWRHYNNVAFISRARRRCGPQRRQAVTMPLAAVWPKKGGVLQTIRGLGRGVAVTVALLFCVGSATAAPTLLIIYSGLAPPTAQMMASGLFSTIDTFDASAS